MESRALWVVATLLIFFLRPAHVNGSLAFYVQVYDKNIVEVYRLMERLHRPEEAGFVYAIHVDAKLDVSDPDISQAYDRFVSRWENMSNVMLLPSHKVTYRGVSMLLSTLDGISALLAADDRWHHFINLSGSDYPLMDPFLMESILRDCRGGNHSFLRFDNRNVTRTSAVYMSNRYLINWEDGALAGKEAPDVRAYNGEHGQRSHRKRDGFWYMYGQPTFPVHKGSAWVVLSREAAQFAAYSSESRWLLAFSAHTCSSPEQFFHTLLAQSRDLWGRVVDVDLRYTDWRGQSQHPRVLTESSNWKQIRGTGKLFARKMQGDVSSTLMDNIDESLLWYPSDVNIDPPTYFSKSIDAARKMCGLEGLYALKGAFRMGMKIPN
eukprot:g1832.t1